MSSTVSTTFRDAVENSLQQKQIGENGMPEYTNKGIGSDVLALSQLVRGGNPTSLLKDILNREDDNKQEIVDAIVLLFVTRNCRGGKGEKKLSFDMFIQVWKYYPETCKDLLKLFPHYGYWKDLLLLMVAAQDDPTFIVHKNNLIDTSILLMKEQLAKDVAALDLYKSNLRTVVDEAELQKLKRTGPSISLLPKWMPRENSSFDKKIGFVKRFTGSSNMKPVYRRQITELTSYLDLPEVLLAAKREDEIRFGRLAAKATMNLRKVFLNEEKDGSIRSRDPKRIRLAERFVKYTVEKGLKGAQLMPHEIVEKIISNRKMSKAEELVLDAQWKDLWKNVLKQVEVKAAEDGAEFNPTHMVPMCDVSGSMYGTPMNVAVALSIGISEITHDAFKNMVLTFDSVPRWHMLNPTASIVEKVRSLVNAPWGMSTNFEAAYDKILEVVERSKMPREEMPSLIVFSDMQFNEAGGYRRHPKNWDTMHDVIRKKVNGVATRLGWTDSEPTPTIYWNLRNTGGHPVDKDTEGTVMLSGYSPSLLKMVMYGEALREEEVQVVEKDGKVVSKKVRITPEEILRRMLDDSLYDPVRDVLSQSNEKCLLEFEIVPAERRTPAEESSDENEDFTLL